MSTSRRRDLDRLEGAETEPDPVLEASAGQQRPHEAPRDVTVARDQLAPHLRPVRAPRAADPEFEPDPITGRQKAPERTFKRGDVYSRPVIDGRQVPDNAWTRFREWLQAVLTSQSERDEAELEERLRKYQRGVTRTNMIAVVSPKGGVGKTTCTFLLGNLLATHLRLRVVAVDANPDFGTLGSLAPDEVKPGKTLADVIADLDQISSAAELRPYVAPLPSGLHLMAAPADARAMREMTPDLYGKLTAFLGQFYDVVLLDLGTGLTDPIAEFAIQRADQSLVVTTPEFVTASNVLGALRYLRGEQGNENLTVVLNQAPERDHGDRKVIEAEFRRAEIERRVTIPYDDRLRTMLDSSTYTLSRLKSPTRMPVKELGLAVASQLV